jgi:type VI secretion system protein ImpH
LFGLGQAAMCDRDALSDHAKLYMAGRLTLQTRPAEGMQAMLEELFQVPMHVEQYVGEWMTLPDASHFLLGLSPDTGSLGMTATLGTRVWGGQHKFRILCGPLSNEDFRRFLPGGRSLEKLSATVRNYVGDELVWEIQLLLVGSEVPNVILGQQGRLGWTSWIGEKPDAAVTDDVVLRPAELIHEVTAIARKHARAA